MGMHFRVHGGPFRRFSNDKGRMLYIIQRQGVRDLPGLMSRVGGMRPGAWKGKKQRERISGLVDIYPYYSVKEFLLLSFYCFEPRALKTKLHTLNMNIQGKP